MDGDELTAPEIAYLRGGAWEAVRTGLAMLYLRGCVEPVPQLASRAGSLPSGADAFEAALHSAVVEAATARDLLGHTAVRRAARALRATLLRRKLLRPRWQRIVVPLVLLAAPPYLLGRFAELGASAVPVALLAMLLVCTAAPLFLPRRTFAGARTLRQLRLTHPEPPVAEPTRGRRRPRIAPEQAGLAVALFGDAGLEATVPLLATEAQVLGGRRTRWSARG